MAEVIYQRDFQATSPVTCADGRIAKCVDLPGESALRWGDGGQSLTLEPWEQEEDCQGMFVRIMSWQDGAEREDLAAHPAMRRLLGKRVRVTVEVLDAC